MILEAIGGALLCASLISDTFIRFRLKGLGQKWVFLRGATLDYGEYWKIREKHGWPAWPVYAFWMTVIPGIFLLALGLVLSHGAN